MEHGKPKRSGSASLSDSRFASSAVRALRPAFVPNPLGGTTFFTRATFGLGVWMSLGQVRGAGATAATTGLATPPLVDDRRRHPARRQPADGNALERAPVPREFLLGSLAEAPPSGACAWAGACVRVSSPVWALASGCLRPCQLGLRPLTGVATNAVAASALGAR